jgi:UDP-N-acetylmuramoyl-tripeptide--D-alanyl-D-alanine ligase
MSSYTLKEILEATSGRLIRNGIDTFSGISIDSRTIREGELFIALRGQRFDGHNYVNEALKKGGGALVSYPPVMPLKGKSIIHVSNTLKALQSIAHYRRIQRDTSVVGITGTNGKTTTKEMACLVLREAYRVLCSKGNLNNNIGLPLSLSELDGHDIAVLEMGASRVGDIRELSDIARPDIGVITNIGPAHLEGFGSLEMVRNTKLELLEYVDTIIINRDDPQLRSIFHDTAAGRERVVITFGLNSDADIWAEDITLSERETSFRLCRKNESINVRLKVPGKFNIYNALGAAAVCLNYDVPLESIGSAIEKFSGIPMRLELKEMKGALVISDLYNANPSSMEEAVKELIRLKRSRAVAVLGDMLELGSYGVEAHRKLGHWLSTLPVDILIGVGELSSYVCEEFKGANGKKQSIHVKDTAEARKVLMSIVSSEDTVLIKGSRGMRLEGVLEN